MRRTALVMTFFLAAFAGAALADPPPPPPARADGGAAPSPPSPLAFDPKDAKAQTDKDLVITRYADLALRFGKGRITVEKVAPGRLASPQKVRRYRGRFEARVLGGGRVLEAVQFDFPFLADADAGVAGELDQRLRALATSQTTVRVPLPDGADEIRLADRRVPAPVPPVPPVAIPVGKPKNK